MIKTDHVTKGLDQLRYYTYDIYCQSKIEHSQQRPSFKRRSWQMQVRDKSHISHHLSNMLHSFASNMVRAKSPTIVQQYRMSLVLATSLHAVVCGNSIIQLTLREVLLPAIACWPDSLFTHDMPLYKNQTRDNWTQTLYQSIPHSTIKINIQLRTAYNTTNP
jgi:hypothetical protein